MNLGGCGVWQRRGRHVRPAGEDLQTFGEYVPADLETLAKARGSSSLTGTAEEAYALQSDVTRRWEPS